MTSLLSTLNEIPIMNFHSEQCEFYSERRSSSIQCKRRYRLKGSISLAKITFSRLFKSFNYSQYTIVSLKSHQKRRDERTPWRILFLRLLHHCCRLHKGPLYQYTFIEHIHNFFISSEIDFLAIYYLLTAPGESETRNDLRFERN
jgi:hypothetical protein